MIDAGIGANSANDPAYDIGNSIKFESANTESLTKSQTASNRRTWTVSFWFKKTKVDSATQYIFEAGSSGSNLFSLFINGINDWRIYEYVSGARKLGFYSTTQLNDPAAWYHMVIACDTTQSSAADRFKIYLNGEDLTAISGYFSTAQYPDQNYETNINNSSATVSIGKAPTASTNFCGYISEFNFIDGLMKDASDFGRFDSASGIWVPKEYTGSYGNEGYFLNFADASDLGDDESGNGNDFTENNITAADQATDTPTNNFATWQINNYNPTVSANFTFLEGATTPKRNSGDVHLYCVSTMAMSSGKWYMEYKVRNSGDSVYFGGTPITKFAFENHNGYYLGQDGGGSIGYGSGGWLYYWTGANNQYTENRATGDIIGVALDKDNNKIAFSKNGTFMQGSNGVRSDPATPSTMHEVQPPPYFWAFGANTGNTQHETNMGGFTTMSISSAASDANGYGTFEYAPPSGYYALCTKNLAEYG